MSNFISVNLKGNNSKRIAEPTLDAYSIKKYKKLYIDAKTQVRQDIKKFSVEYNTITPKDITVLVMAELLPKDKRKEYLNKHTKFFTYVD